MSHDRSWRLKIGLAFAAVYFIWGSTYLAIRVGVETLPPALFAGLRFLAAGLLLTGYAWLTGQTLPRTPREWKTIIVAALLLLVAANGLVVWGEQWVPSNQAALLVATVALWLAGLGMLGSQGEPLSFQRRTGLALGFGGAVVLLWPDDGFNAEHLAAQLAILLAAFCWAAGSIYIKRARPTTPPILSAGLQSLVAGVILCLLGLLGGEPARWSWHPEALLALAYLIVFGSCLAYAAYVWLLHEVSPAALGTYGYVNPAVAVVLGAALLGETLNALQLAGMFIILAGVVLVSTARVRG